MKLDDFEEGLVQRLRENQKFATVHLQETLKCLIDTHASAVEKAASLLTLGYITRAYGGFGKIAKKAGVSKGQLAKAFAPGGNPTLNMLTALSDAVNPHMTAQAA